MLIDSFFDKTVSEFLQNPLYKTLQNDIAHSDWTVYEHSLHVAAASYLYAKRRGLSIDYRSLIRGAMLHDFYLYDWHKDHKGHRLHGFRHPGFALRNAEKNFSLNFKEKNIIHSHMFPLTFYILPLSREAWIVSTMDSAVAWLEVLHPHSFPLSNLVFGIEMA